MPFFQPATFYAPAQVDSNAFSNLFQLINDFDGYQRAQRESGESKKQQQQQQHRKVQAKPQPQSKPAQKKESQEPKEPKESKEPKTVYRHPFEEFFSGLQHAAAAAAEAQRHTALPTFNPRFDVRETQDTYELHGELAGVDRSNISLEFTEPQTLVVSGKVERNYCSRNGKEVPALENTPDAMADDDDAASAATGGARTPTHEEFTDVSSQRSASPARSHRATVADEEEEAALERGRPAASNDKTAVVTTPALVAAAPNTPAAPNEKFWLKERSIGQFKREFNFPVPVDADKVHASLENGILSVSVPKTKREARRIVVF